MDDTIYRQVALEAMETWGKFGCDPDGKLVKYNDNKHIPYVHYEDMVYAIKHLPSAQPKWIPVTERLPENDNDVLVTDGTDCAVAYWRTSAQAWDDSMHGWCDLYGLDVIAWMPLPEPYKEDKKK